jgi:multidrug resistance efflux pump
MRRRYFYIAAIAVFLAYSAWIIGPYVRSVIVRDAAVTTWLRAAVAPIDGKIMTDLPNVGGIVGEDGHIVTIRNALLFQENRSLEDTRDKALEAKNRIKEAEEFLADLAVMDRARVAEKKNLSRVFHEQLETEIKSLRATLVVNRERIAVLERIAKRQRSLVGRGAGSRASLDEALLRLAEMKARQVDLQAKLNFALLRDKSAEQGIFITAEGGTPNWVHHGELELKLEERRVRHEAHVAEEELAEALGDLKIQENLLEKLSEARVTAPPGSLITSILVPPGATLSAGDRLVEWINCRQLLVDVPVSDAELPLIELGMPAEVVLEGESEPRAGTVHLTRGSSATLGRTDLAAVAKGRAAGIAQVLLTLGVEPEEFGRCPVGRAAHVSFPGVGLIDVMRARLRL